MSIRNRMYGLLEWVASNRLDAKSKARDAENRFLFLLRKGRRASANRALKKGLAIRKEYNLRPTVDHRSPIDYRETAIDQSRPYQAGGSQKNFKRKHGMRRRGRSTL